MDLPEIPGEAVAAAADEMFAAWGGDDLSVEHYRKVSRLALEASRAHLYAAALRHAAENLVYEAAAANQLRRMADEALS